MNKKLVSHMEVLEFSKDLDHDGVEEVFSKSVRAGRRTYFFDVKATRNNDYYLTITESRKKQGRDGNFVFEKHKIYLYKEDFCKFDEGLEEAISFIRSSKPELFNLDGTVVKEMSLDEEFAAL